MLIKIGFFIFVFIKLLFLAKIDKVASCYVAILDDDCCQDSFWKTVDCPGPFKPKCNIFNHNCVACAYIYSTAKACIPQVQCSCYYCCDPQYAKNCPDGCRECVKDGEGGCPENSAAQFKSIGNSSSSSMHEYEAKAREHFDMVDVDKNGSISLNEAINHLKSKLKNGTSASNLAVNMSWFAEIDHNGNNQIEPGEFDRSLI
uniref:EF-hand domain-containing protein n=1 Tax=Globodera rostochiensis TaxID=31243 RepID=A0A914HKM1_GLORO